MSPKSLVIGAGAAGLAAAARLFANGFTDVLILEAGNRIGGRVWTVPFGNQLVELGAQWCHGQKNNVLYELAKPQDLLEESTFAQRNVLLFSDGYQTSKEVTRSLMSLAHRLVDSEEIRQAKGTLGENFVKKFKEEVPKMDGSIEPDVVDGFIESYHRFLKGKLAIDSWGEASGNCRVGYEKCEGSSRLAWKGKGAKTALELIMKSEAFDENKISKNKRVKNINYTQKQNGKVSVTCEDNSNYEADHVIVTVPLGVLKEKHQTLFTPTLPTTHTNAIEGLNSGNVNKAFLEFETPFWREHGNVFRLVWRADDLHELRSSKFSWAEGILTFSSVDYCPNVLGVRFVGKEALQAELLPDSEILDGLKMLLKKFFVGIDVPEPTRFIRSKFSTDPDFRGAYSSRSIKTEQLQTGATDLAQPLLDSAGKPVVLFAGEATSPQHWSTLHGAIETGWREADRLIEIYKN
ncbi:spermine oxidase-like [Culex pipiens pallens]|uniref:spermine oxidase-like n=1 Tax=Culex pipiens pallens TaxID=42434 RepID=UPI001952A58C|nr:spermine oxidase-like [Culex pipiens pallens]